MKKINMIILSSLLMIVPSLTSASYYGGGYGMMSGWGLGGGFGGSGGIFSIIFWILIIFLFFGFMRHGSCGMGSHFNKSDNPKNALDILKERYAKGEIDKKQFEDMKKDLEK